MFKIQNKNEFISNYQAGTRNFRQIILTAVNLTGSNLEQIGLDESSLVEVNWSNCNLHRASFKKAYLGLSNFQNCCLISANFQGANLEEANLARANLAEADLRQANLRRANFKGANLQGAKLENACFSEAVYDSATVFNSDFSPQAAGMILTETAPSSPKVNFRSQKNKSAVQKILSWCRTPRFDPQTQT